jgi:hypothetical protein
MRSSKCSALNTGCLVQWPARKGKSVDDLRPHRCGPTLVVTVRLTRQKRITEIVGAREMTETERKEFELWESGR